MPRYYFDLSDGSREPDEIGNEIQNDALAEQAGIKFLGEILKHEPTRLAHGSLCVNVRDDAGGEPFKLSVVIDRKQS